MADGIFSYINFSNLELIEDFYQNWLKNPASVDPTWAHFFEGMQFAGSMPSINLTGASPDLRVFYLITAYRTYGHLMAHFNPIQTNPPFPAEELKIENFGFTQADLTNPFPTCGFLKEQVAPLKEIIEALERTYCRTIGIEYMGLGFPEIEKWLQEKIEPNFEFALSQEEKIRILDELNKAETFETFIHTKYVGQKRFSLEGAETLIPMLMTLLEEGEKVGVAEAILGMAHRGRLNVLANIFGKSYAYIFREFEDHYSPDLSEGTGDVKYHKGFVGTYQTPSGKKIPVILSANPSHLESVDPVVEGGVRAQQEIKAKDKRREVVPILIHGDAAVAGQGIVYETMQLGKLNGYNTGGTIHIVINNQIGFTTLPKDGRSTRYCTDIAKTFGSPVFHVNAEDPEGCVAAAKLAIQLRQQFGCDVFIDLNGYRKYGHNEGDEPFFTQPLEYALIKSKKSIREIYREHLIQGQTLDPKIAQQLEEEFKNSLKSALESAKGMQEEVKPAKRAKQNVFAPVDTKVDVATLVQLAQKFCTVPSGFKLNPKIEKILKDRLQMVQNGVDWALAEFLAFATLCTQKIHVRLSGQDSRRGTFSQRHAVWIDQMSAQKYFPLSHLSATQAPCDIFNSPLSEYAVLGFEFGYSLLYQNALVLWEAQYGDFFNGAQIIVDQYISAAEQKWGHRCNLTLLLPHGYEGQGPEHSSARIERFLQLAGEENMFIANCTTPAQYFHLLRRQGLNPIKKPLIVFTPKVLLRHPLCISPQKDFTSGSFNEILEDLSITKPKKVVLCSGKFYYEVLQEREKRKNTELAIVRIEQLYPFHEEKLGLILDQYKEMSSCIWAQEEHQNMGAWDFVRPIIEKLLKGRVPLRYAGRERSAATAAGSYALHKKQHEAIIQEIFK